MGASGDLQIYHDGTYNRIAADAQIFLQNKAANETYIAAYENGAVELYHNNNKKLETTSGGGELTGTWLPAADATGNFGSTSKRWGTVYATSFSGSGANLTGINTDLVSDTSPQLGGDLDTNSNDINFVTNDKAQFGNSQQLKIYYDGSNSIVTAGGAGDLQLISTFDDVEIRAADNVFIRPKAGEDGIKVLADAAVELYHNNTKKFETKASGATLTGENLTITSTADVDLVLSADTDNVDESHVPTITFQSDGSTTKFKLGVEGAAGDTFTGSETNTPYILGVLNNTNLQVATNSTARWHWTSSGHFYPSANDSYDIGSSNLRVRNIYTGDLHMSNEGSSNDVDSTWGDYTIQEGFEDLYLINNRTGKKFKFNLTEVS